MNDQQLIEERKKKVLHFFRKNTSLVAYALLAVIVFIAVKIRIANLPGLRDITTGDWTLGPDLDPFLFLRWAKYIVEHGSLMAIDTMRYVPLGFNTAYELNLHVYLMTWFHTFASFFGSSSVTQSAVLYPVFMFALAVVAFFLMVRKLFIAKLGIKQANAIALVSSLFLSIIPALLPRTIAGIPEKEASALVFLFLAFYFFISGWESKGKVKRYVFAFLSGLSTALMGLVWGGYLYILLTIGPAIIVAFLLGKMDRGKKYFYSLWLLTTIFLLLVGTKRYPLADLLTSTTTISCIFAFLLIVVDSLLFETGLKKMVQKRTRLARFPTPFISFVTTIVVGALASSVVFGPRFIINKIVTLKNFLVTTGVDRLNLTVAENRQPYFIEWVSSFGPHVLNIPLTFWIFFAGAIYLFYTALEPFKRKDRGVTTTAFALFLISLIFSRYAPESMFNGTNAISLLFYALGPLVLIVIAARYYMRYYKSGETDRLKHIEFSFIFILCFFLISLISARSGVRLIMMLVPAASILVSYVLVSIVIKAKQTKRNNKPHYLLLIIAGITALAVLFSAYQFYGFSKATAEQYVPSQYNQQWQKAMSWVRENTPQGAVFGHWWDYGYWVQSIGERATVLDGGNAKSYWNHMMARYALTGTSNQDALEFLYAHNTTHFLIDSTDIGKYGAFSSIGSDQNYDRVSFIAAFNRDLSQVQQKKNTTLFLYTGGVVLDEDIIYMLNGTQVFLPGGKAALGAVMLEQSSNGEIIGSPQGIFVYQGRQYTIPIRYLFDGEFKDTGSGIDSGVYIMPRLVTSANGIQVDSKGSLLYLSSRTVHSQFARLYFYGEEDSYFELAHSEDDFLVAQVKTQVPGFNSDFVFYDTIRGPIKMWEINYPQDIQFKEEYLSEVWPQELLRP